MISDNHLDVSLIIPAFNEEYAINKLIAQVDRVLQETTLKYELILVDDGSQDETLRKALIYSQNNSNLKVRGYAENRGKGYAIRKGFSLARGDIIIILDSDLDIDPSQIKSYIRALKHGDLVIASKSHPQSVVSVPLLRRFLSYWFNLLVKLITGLKIQDTQTGLKAFRRKELEPVFSVLTVHRFAFDVELLTVANLHGLKIIELPLKIKLSNVIFHPLEIVKMFKDLLCIAFRLRVTHLYS